VRRIIRRALRHGYKLGIQEPFFYKLVEVLEAEMATHTRSSRAAVPRAARVWHRKQDERFASSTLAQTAHGVAAEGAPFATCRAPKVIDGDIRVQAVRTPWLSGRSDGRRGARRGPRDLDQTRF